ncbi:MAG: hypothetical protein IJM09_02955, partial [Neisseriaceae bacterium]|nr:hypothetical protein [Neisseriaceae bacterium]
MRIPFVVNVSFLSRLFGGEHCHLSYTHNRKFLSRLFGGELEVFYGLPLLLYRVWGIFAIFSLFYMCFCKPHKYRAWKLE